MFRSARLVATLVAAAVAMSACSSSKSAQEPASSTTAGTKAKAAPNIVFLLADDLDLAEMQYLPNVRRLIGDEGVTLDDYFVSNSLCCPSRATMLRGEYAHNTGVFSNAGDEGGYPAVLRHRLQPQMVAPLLRRAGYRTGLVGKYFNGYPSERDPEAIPPGWDDWVGTVDSAHSYIQFGYDVVTHDGTEHHGNKPADYGTTVYTNAAAKMLAARATPRFLYLAYYAPHPPATPAPRDAAKFPGVTAPRTPSYDETDVTDKPSWLRAIPRLSAREQQGIDVLYRRRIQSLQAVDRSVQTLVDQLQRRGELDNTYVIFTSDNGFHLGQHRLPAGKRTPYDEDIHVPFMVRGPGIAKGTHVDAITGNVDLLPTFADIAGTPIPNSADGRSMLGLWHGATAPDDWRQAYLLEHHPEPATNAAANPDNDLRPNGTGVIPMLMASEPQRIPSYTGLRFAHTLYVEYDDGERELYDLRADPNELDNIAAAADASTLARYHSMLAALRACAGDTCREADAATRE